MEELKKLKQAIEEKIEGVNNVVIVPHTGVDFDAIGSALGVSLIAKKFNKPFCIVMDDPVHKIDQGVKMILDEVILKNNTPIITRDKYLKNRDDNDLFILTDVNKSYLVSVKDELNDEEKIIIIDHHDEDSATIKAETKYINSNVSSACEIITKLLCLYKIKICPDIANYLLAGIYLDTNKFTKNVTCETMKIMTKLMEYGADVKKVTEYFEEDFVSDRRIQELVSRAQIQNYSIAIVLGEKEMEYTKEELAKVADYLLRYRVDAAFAIGNIGDNTVSISARAKEKINVGDIMKQLEGGGNPYSGATKLTECSVEEAGKRLAKVLTPSFYKNVTE